MRRNAQEDLDTLQEWAVASSADMPSACGAQAAVQPRAVVCVACGMIECHPRATRCDVSTAKVALTRIACVRTVPPSSSI